MLLKSYVKPAAEKESSGHAVELGLFLEFTFHQRIPSEVQASDNQVTIQISAVSNSQPISALFCVVQSTL